ncbi:hypothetical protein N9A49_04835 [Salibacteraceae bacterium]|nr:hypothetical protein [Salibacteraceae bacterium]
MKIFFKIILFIILLVVGSVLLSVWSLDFKDSETNIQHAMKLGKSMAQFLFSWFFVLFTGVLYTVLFKWQKKWKYLIFILIASVLIHEEKFYWFICLTCLFMWSDTILYTIIGLNRPDIKNSKSEQVKGERFDDYGK